MQARREMGISQNPWRSKLARSSQAAMPQLLCYRRSAMEQVGRGVRGAGSYAALTIWESGRSRDVTTRISDGYGMRFIEG